jgi:hypothetical protein
MMAAKQEKRCPKCGRRTKKGWKYCHPCSRAVRRAMRDSGYLTPLPRTAEERTAEAMEDIAETRRGFDPESLLHPDSLDNTRDNP